MIKTLMILKLPCKIQNNVFELLWRNLPAIDFE